MSELPGVGEDGMSGRNVQRKLGTTRGSPRRSRTAKASRISRRAVKSRCAREWDGWGRLSDDGPGHDPATGGFYVQAFDGAVTLPAAGYDYDIDWTPLSAGLAPAGMAASFAALGRIGAEGVIRHLAE